MNNKSAIVVLLMALMIITTVTAVPAYQKRACADFVITNPREGEKFDNNSQQTVTVDAKNSGISDILEVDLFRGNGTYYSTLWVGDKKVGGDPVSISFTLEVNPQLIPGIFFYRVWAQEATGSNCFQLSHNFTIEK
ncbi:6820_t:CDS:2 [Paraglomus occultum]|uniref:6820_t:CDS:1 n=1 Tax=Paraglomus occultum TaxID=144539 RepID=A0A9N9CQT4_9GLOM|nr:6820_t:CDS:2 [Paraglomus occultum]